jgi:hypothetical protein
MRSACGPCGYGRRQEKEIITVAAGSQSRENALSVYACKPLNGRFRCKMTIKIVLEKHNDCSGNSDSKVGVEGTGLDNCGPGNKSVTTCRPGKGSMQQL